MPKRVSLSPLILVLALAKLDSPPSGFTQEKASADKIDQQDVIRRDVDLLVVLREEIASAAPLPSWMPRREVMSNLSHSCG